MTTPRPLADPLNGVLQRYSGNAHRLEVRKKPGRPKKRTPEYLQAVLVAHLEVQAWFVASYGSRPASDRELYTAFFADQFHTAGGRAGCALTPRFQRSLKTLRNELSEARRLHRERPENPSISGTPSLVQSSKCSLIRPHPKVLP